MEEKREACKNCSVLYCVPHLFTVLCAQCERFFQLTAGFGLVIFRFFVLFASVLLDLAYYTGCIEWKVYYNGLAFVHLSIFLMQLPRVYVTWPAYISA